MPFYHPSYYKKLKKLSSASEAQATGESRETGENRESGKRKLKRAQANAVLRRPTQDDASERTQAQANVD
jgi:hypothetical protein